MKMRINARKASSNCAFTLMETIVASALGTIMFSALYGCVVWGFGTLHAVRENLRATQILVARTEAVRLCPFDQLTNPTNNPPTFTEYYAPGSQTNGGGGAVYDGTFSAVVPATGTLPESYRTNMLLVTVGVSWTSCNRLHSRTTQTYAARNGMEGFVSTGQ
jgi:hypothetical protein